MKHLFAILMSFVVCFSCLCESKLSPYTLNFIEKFNSINSDIKTKASKQLIKDANDKYLSLAFIEFNEELNIEELKEFGITVGTKCGNILTATIPINNIKNIAKSPKIKRVDVARNYRACNDVAMVKTGVDKIHAGIDLPNSYNGKGVIYGTLDVGIDFDHIAFKDEDGNNRIKWAYLPTNNSGSSVTGTVYDQYGNITYNGTFPGSEFTSSQLSDLQTDTKRETHGTHTIGTASGSFTGNQYSGMAPESEIIACGSETLSDVNIVNSVSYIFGKAQEENKPAVVNLSLAGYTGSHDGTSYVPYFLDKLVGPGRIVVVSAGNAGETPLYIYNDCQKNNSMKTFFRSPSGNYNLIAPGDNASFSIYSRAKTNFNIAIVVYDTSSNAIVYSSPIFTPDDDGNTYTIDSSLDKNFAQYVNGSIMLSGALLNNKYSIGGDMSFNTTSNNYLVGMVLTSDNNAQLDCWADAYLLTFGSGNIDSWIDGNSNSSINDMATGQNIISVGAYVSRFSFMSMMGTETTFNNYGPMGDIAGFSSYGADANGIARPEVVAPGFIVVSSISAYATSYSNPSKDVAYQETINGHLQRWALMWGTSMASPCVAGGIATWLQANPQLTPNDIKEIISKSSIIDDFVKGNPNKWGAGKFDAYNGLKEVLKLGSLNGVENNNQTNIIITPNPSNGKIKILLPSDCESGILKIYDLAGRLISQNYWDRTQNIDLGNQLNNGIYLINLITSNKCFNTRIIINK